MISDVRIAFAKLWKAEQINGEGKPKFGAVLIIEPNSANAKALASAMTEVATEKWKAKAPQVLAQLKKDDKLCYREKEKTNATGDVYEGFEGKHFVNASTEARPLVIDRDRSPLTEQDGRPYSGCYANVQLDIWPQANKYGLRVNATLKAVQFVRDGDAFSGGTPASLDDFPEMGAGEEPDELAA